MSRNKIRVSIVETGFGAIPNTHEMAAVPRKGDTVILDNNFMIVDRVVWTPEYPYYDVEVMVSYAEVGE